MSAVTFDTSITLEGDANQIIKALDLIKKYATEETKITENGNEYTEYIEYIEITNKKKKVKTSNDYTDFMVMSDDEIRSFVEQKKGKVKYVNISASGPFGDYGMMNEMSLPYIFEELVIEGNFNFIVSCRGNDCGDDCDYYVKSEDKKLYISYEVSQNENVVYSEEKVWDIRTKKFVIEGFEDCDTLGDIVSKFNENKTGFDARTSIIKSVVSYDEFLKTFDLEAEQFNFEEYTLLFSMWDLTRYDLFTDLCKPCKAMPKETYEKKVQNLMEIRINI